MTVGSARAGTGFELRSLVRSSGELELSLARVAIPIPAHDEVVLRVDAAPINPSDIGLMFGAADLGTARQSGTPASPVIITSVPEDRLGSMAGRLGRPLPVGNEGAGVVVETGDADAARALLGRTVAVSGGAMYAQYRCAKADACLVLPGGATAADGASCFVNPLTALGMVETMRAEGHTALVHTAAASNPGQMLNRVCLADGVGLVNIVRTAEWAAHGAPSHGGTSRTGRSMQRRVGHAGVGLHPRPEDPVMTSRSTSRLAARRGTGGFSMLASVAFAATDLLDNPGFDGSLAGWDNLYGRTASWSPIDAGGDPGSGSAVVVNESNPRNGATPLVLTQCVSVTPTTEYLYGGVAMVLPGQPDGTYAQIFADTYTSNDCSTGAQVEALSTSLVGAWDVLSGSITTGVGVHSLVVGLCVFKNEGLAVDASGRFDNIYLHRSTGVDGFLIGPGMSGNWYDPAESGHGIMLEMLDGGRAWMCWYAFDLAGNPAWICALGTLAGDTIEFPSAFTVQGGKFPPLFDPAAVVGAPWGSITVTFTGCNAGNMQWSTSAPGFQSGSMPLARVTTLGGDACVD
jgi:hypothetical protein